MNVTAVHTKRDCHSRGSHLLRLWLQRDFKVNRPNRAYSKASTVLMLTHHFVCRTREKPNHFGAPLALGPMNAKWSSSNFLAIFILATFRKNTWLQFSLNLATINWHMSDHAASDDWPTQFSPSIFLSLYLSRAAVRVFQRLDLDNTGKSHSFSVSLSCPYDSRWHEFCERSRAKESTETKHTRIHRWGDQMLFQRLELSGSWDLKQAWNTNSIHVGQFYSLLTWKNEFPPFLHDAKVTLIIENIRSDPEMESYSHFTTAFSSRENPKRHFQCFVCNVKRRHARDASFSASGTWFRPAYSDQVEGKWVQVLNHFITYALRMAKDWVRKSPNMRDEISAAICTPAHTPFTFAM